VLLLQQFVARWLVQSFQRQRLEELLVYVLAALRHADRGARALVEQRVRLRAVHVPPHFCKQVLVRHLQRVFKEDLVRALRLLTLAVLLGLAAVRAHSLVEGTRAHGVVNRPRHIATAHDGLAGRSVLNRLLVLKPDQVFKFEHAVPRGGSPQIPRMLLAAQH